MRWVFLVLTVLGSALLYWLGIRLKLLTLRGDELVIGNFRNEITVPLRDVERVSGSVLLNPEVVWIHFRRPTEFGDRIISWRGSAGSGATRVTRWFASSASSSIRRPYPAAERARRLAEQTPA